MKQKRMYNKTIQLNRFEQENTKPLAEPQSYCLGRGDDQSLGQILPALVIIIIYFETNILETTTKEFQQAQICLASHLHHACFLQDWYRNPIALTAASAE